MKLTKTNLQKNFLLKIYEGFSFLEWDIPF